MSSLRKVRSGKRLTTQWLTEEVTAQISSSFSPSTGTTIEISVKDKPDYEGPVTVRYCLSLSVHEAETLSNALNAHIQRSKS